MAAHATVMLSAGLADGVIMHVADWRERKEIREAMPPELRDRVRYDVPPEGEMLNPWTLK
jgi:hypothetical protein